MYESYVCVCLPICWGLLKLSIFELYWKTKLLPKSDTKPTWPHVALLSSSCAGRSGCWCWWSYRSCWWSYWWRSSCLQWTWGMSKMMNYMSLCSGCLTLMNLETLSLMRCLRSSPLFMIWRWKYFLWYGGGNMHLNTGLYIPLLKTWNENELIKLWLCLMTGWASGACLRVLDNKLWIQNNKLINNRVSLGSLP